MSADQHIMIAILALTFALLIKSKIPPVAVFVGALTLTVTFRLAPLDESLKGFSNPGMLTVGALLMVAAGMYRTGAITLITDKLIGLPKSLLAAQAKILPPVAVGSAFLNNTPLVAMFIPVIRDLAKISRLPAPRLYIPLSFASILGGTCTLIGTSTNLVVAGMVIDFLAKGDPNAPSLREIAMFDLTWIGLPVTVAGIVLANLFALNQMIDEKVTAKLDSPEFLRKVVENIQPHFFIFDENEEILIKSKSIVKYVDLNGLDIVKEGKNLRAIRIKTKEFIDFPPILTSLDEDVYFNKPEGDNEFFCV